MPEADMRRPIGSVSVAGIPHGPKFIFELHKNGYWTQSRRAAIGYAPHQQFVLLDRLSANSEAAVAPRLCAIRAVLFGRPCRIALAVALAAIASASN